MKGQCRKIRLILVFLIQVFALPCHAGSFNINPVRILLSSSVATEVLHVTNSGNSDVTVQLQTKLWSQNNGEDELKSTRDLIATPQIFNLKAGTSQIVRIGLAKKPDFSREMTYRLILEEIPPPLEPGFQGLRLALRISLPVFVRPSGQSAQSVEAHIAQQNSSAPDALSLELINTGRTHIQFLNFKIHPADDPEELLATLEKNIYLLAGQKRQISLKTYKQLPSTSAILIRAETSAGKVEFHATRGSP